MKISIYLLALLLFFASLPSLDAQEYGRFRALEQRAAVVIKQKNDFVSRVLTSYAIPHERNGEGAVVRIFTDGQWLNVTTVEIVPLLKEGADKKQQVIGHELLFYTALGVLDLVSEMTVR